MQGRRSTAELRAHNDYEKSKIPIYPDENKKEVIPPQVPLRWPCDDLPHLTEFRFELIKN